MIGVIPAILYMEEFEEDLEKLILLSVSLTFYLLGLVIELALKST